MSNLLIEVTSSPVTILSEGKDGDGRMKIRANLGFLRRKRISSRCQSKLTLSVTRARRP